MPGLGTIINVALILAGGTAGLIGGRFITNRVQDALLKASALCVLFIGLAGALEKMLGIEGGTLKSGGSAMVIVSFAVGALIGEALGLERRMERLGEWLRDRFSHENVGDAKNANGFVDAFVTTSLTVCIGAMAIVGSIQDGIMGDWSTLALKGALDCIIVCAMTASMGRGAVFSALPVGVLQGTITLLARFIQPVMTTTALNNLSLVGSMLIFCVGVNLIWGKTFRTANLLPAVVVAVIWALVIGA